MKIRFSAVLCFIVSFMMIINGSVACAAGVSGTSIAPDPESISITNNAGASDTVKVTYGLSSGDVVKVYNAATGGKLLGSATVYSNKTDATVTLSQLGTNAGSVYVSVTSKGMLESSRVKADYSAEPKSEAPSADNITIVNNVKSSDTITVSGLAGGDVVRVYNAATGGKQLGSATVYNNKTEATVSISQIGSAAGSLYVTVTSKYMLESDRVKVNYEAEPKTQDPDVNNIYVTNNAGASDTVNVTALTGGDVVKVYNAATGGKQLGSATVAANKTEATVTIAQIGAAAGKVYVTVTSKGMVESNRVAVDYPAEAKTDAPGEYDVAVVNNAKAADTVTVSNVSGGNIVKVYDSVRGGKLLGSATVPTYDTEVTITIPQLGTAAGSVYVTVTGKNKQESDRLAVNYPAESKTDAPDEDNITIVNNVGAADTVTVMGIGGGDTVKVYDSPKGGSLLGSAAVSTYETQATVSIPQIGSAAGSVYVTVTSKNKQESDRVEAEFKAEMGSDAPDVNNITIANNVGVSDTVTVTGLSGNDVVKVYDSARGGKLLGSATVSSSGTSAVVSISQLGTSAGTVYVSVTGKGLRESGRTGAAYSAESQSTAPDAYNITVVNNAVSSDTIKVYGLSAGDVVKVYDSDKGGNLLGSSTVASGNAEATVTVAQLGTTAGSVYVSVTSKSKQESARVKKDYAAETKTDTSGSGNIAIVNNAGLPDTVTVYGLSAGDVVKVYDSAQGGSLLGSATVSASATDATVSISQLGTAAGSVYVSVTGVNKQESDRVKADYSAESKTDVLSTDNIIIVNNVDSSDTVTVVGLSAGDVVKVYDSAKGGSLLGSATVSSSGTDAVITVSQLGTAAGSVYVTLTGKGKQESDRVKADYSAESKTDVLSTDNIVIVNNVGSSDTVTVVGLSAGDIVKVYDSARSGNLLGSGTVATYSTDVTVTITQLGTAAGSVYVSVTGTNKQESERIKADYSAESKSEALKAENIIIVNNAGTSDTVQVTGLSEGDVINVYDAARGGNLLGSGTVTTYGSDVTITITQLGTAAGSVYVSVTSKNKQESDRVKADYPAEPKSGAPSAEAITVVNNAGISDTITVTGLFNGDTVKVYDSEKGGTLLGSGTVATYESTATITITQLGTAAGSVYVSVAGSGKLESDRVKVDYPAEAKSDSLKLENITIVNNAGAPDAVKVTGISESDVVKVYDSEKGGNLLGSKTVDTYGSDAVVSISQLGSSAGSVYISITRKGKLESDRIKADYSAEAKSSASDVNSVIVTNNAGIADTVRVTGVSEGDAVNVYDSASGGNLLGSATVPAGSVEVTVSISQLGSSSGYIYVAVKRTGKLESDRTKVCYAEEAKSDAPAVGNIAIVNNAGLADTVTVTFLNEGDIVKVYNLAEEGRLLGYATVETGSTEATVKITQLGTSAGNVYITVTRKGMLESDRVQAYYTQELTTDAPSTNNITVTNNAGISDTVKVVYLTANDVVKVYDSASGGNLLGYATVASGSTEATVSITQLGTSAGNVYVSVTTSGKLESGRTKVYYSEETKSQAPSVNNIIVTNYAGMTDTVKVSFLSQDDVVKVYDSASGGNLLGSASVSSNSDIWEATVKITQLGTSAGYIYVSVTSAGKPESDRTKVYYSEEPTSYAPLAGNITIVNNVGTYDTVRVTGLTANDVVKIYDSASGGKLLGYATVAADTTEVTIKIAQIGTSAGSLYLTVTSPGAYESARTAVNFDAEAQ
ncbi:MAG: hypothetical protein QHH06_11770 [Clostridiales bacterium]|jgi:hypothetical protein|nr:hypothetical protein [Eubacteriales bacterium]MDH7567136.1 hypothetical protein [Clostridiales bacterium]